MTSRHVRSGGWPIGERRRSNPFGLTNYLCVISMPMTYNKLKSPTIDERVENGWVFLFLLDDYVEKKGKEEGKDK